MKNVYKTVGDITFVEIVFKKSYKRTIQIDTEDIPRFVNLRIGLNSSGKYCVVAGGQLLQRFLLNAPKDLQVDHIHGNKDDYRKSQLRLVTCLQNGQNKHGAPIHSRSGIRGVTWKQSKQKWCATVMLNGKSHHLGYYASIEEAEKACIEFRLTNIPDCFG